MKELTFEITDYCSLNCMQCSTMAGMDGNTFFSLQEIEQHLRQFRDFDVVRLSGGEPFEHPELVEIAGLMDRRFDTVQILSCGVRQRRPIPERMMGLLKPYVDEIVFSIHGYIPAHETIVTSDRNYILHPPYWDHMMDSADNAILAGIDISLETVLMRENFGELEDIARTVWGFNQARGKSTRWHILRFVKQGRGEINSDQALDGSRLARLGDIVEDLSARYSIDITCSNSFSGDDCECGSRKAVFTCYGEVIPCSALKYCGSKGRFACRERI